MNKKYIIIGVVVALAILAGFLIGKKSAVAPEVGTLEATTTAPVVTEATSSTPQKQGTVGASKTTVSSPVMNKNGVYIVYYTSHGFSPSTLTIKKGKSVQFVNSSNKAMSIASVDLANQVYGELNQSKTVGKGGTYDFTFVTAGNWTYINRNNPGDKGLIIVQ